MSSCPQTDLTSFKQTYNLTQAHFLITLFKLLTDMRGGRGGTCFTGSTILQPSSPASVYIQCFSSTFLKPSSISYQFRGQQPPACAPEHASRGHFAWPVISSWALGSCWPQSLGYLQQVGCKPCCRQPRLCERQQVPRAQLDVTGNCKPGSGCTRVQSPSQLVAVHSSGTTMGKEPGLHSTARGCLLQSLTSPQGQEGKQSREAREKHPCPYPVRPSCKGQGKLHEHSSPVQEGSGQVALAPAVSIHVSCGRGKADLGLAVVLG